MSIGLLREDLQRGCPSGKTVLNYTAQTLARSLQKQHTVHRLWVTNSFMVLRSSDEIPSVCYVKTYNLLFPYASQSAPTVIPTITAGKPTASKNECERDQQIRTVHTLPAPKELEKSIVCSFMHAQTAPARAPSLLRIGTKSMHLIWST